ncbi:NSFL1 cofactor p47 isoform X2 [Venturia canescens]|nr:NSFL1 cofactor p47 isoform X2 [Venturia canescens]
MGKSSITVGTTLAKENTGACSRPKDKKSSADSKPRSNVHFGTIDRLQNKESSSDEEGQAFYAGGSKHSGQQVLGPSKKKDIINEMFKSCQGQAIAVSEDRPAGQHRNRPNTFGGTGYKLGQTNSDTEVVSGESSSTRSPGSESGTGGSGLRRNTAGVIMLKLWRDGFTINDREIRSYSEPENREFLAAIKRGEIPQEIREEVQGAEVRLDMEDHRHEEYVPSKPKVKAFTGRGHKLGSPSPATVGMTMPTDPADQAANESQARSMLNVDSSRPVTSIQIRLADGNNIRQEFNTSHTVGDVRRFITTMRPQYSLQEFTLLTTYPSRELASEEETIEHAGLQNSAIMQRLK